MKQSMSLVSLRQKTDKKEAFNDGGSSAFGEGLEVPPASSAA